MEAKFVTENLILWISSNAKFIKDQNSPPNPLQNLKRIFGSTNFPFMFELYSNNKISTQCDNNM